METSEGQKPIPFIRELCKHKTEEEIREAEENFREYVKVLVRIGTRLYNERREKERVDSPDKGAL